MFPWNEITAQDESHRSCELPGWDDGHGNTEPDRDGGGHWRGAGCEWFLTSHRGLHSHLSPPHSHDLGPGDQATLLGWCLGIVFVTWIMVHIYIYTSLFTAHVNIDLPEINLRKGRLLLPFKDLNNNILLANLTSRTMKPISHLPEKPPWPFWMSIWSRNIFLSPVFQMKKPENIRWQLTLKIVMRQILKPDSGGWWRSSQSKYQTFYTLFRQIKKLNHIL